jgi:hypothetical protein
MQVMHVLAEIIKEIFDLGSPRRFPQCGGPGQ